MIRLRMNFIETTNDIDVAVPEGTSLISLLFLLYETQPRLNDMHTVFGQILEGFGTLDKWERMSFYS